MPVVRLAKALTSARRAACPGLIPIEDVLDLTVLMERDRIPLLFLNDVNPVYSLPVEGRFAAAIRRVPFTVALTSFLDETSSLASLVLPIHTPLETWGDFEPYRGVHGLMQPVMEPVFPTKALGDLLLETGKKLGPAWKEYPVSFSEYLKEDWKIIHKRGGEKVLFETFWAESLAQGRRLGRGRATEGSAGLNLERFPLQ